jgi:hypothetical protein
LLVKDKANGLDKGFVRQRGLMLINLNGKGCTSSTQSQIADFGYI